MATRADFVQVAMEKLGQQRKSIELAAPNVELTWAIDEEFLTRARYYGSQMLDKRQIRQLPDYETFIDASFVNAMSE